MFDDKEQIWAFFSKISFKAISFLLLAISGLFFVCLGLYYLFSFSNQIQSVDSDCPAEITTRPVSASIFVDISGAVARPGIYQVETNSRVADLVQLAGGFSRQADEKYLSQSFNLASSLTDGQKIYIPFAGELDEIDSSQKSSLISINQSSVEQLESLDGIGQKRAEAIVAGRPYTKIEDLVEKEILSQTLFDQIKSNIKL